MNIRYVSERDSYYLKELIKVNGLRIASAELEAVLVTYPNVAEAVVVGIPL